MSVKDKKISINIQVYIPKEDFTYETQDCFIRATMALFTGLFPHSHADYKGELPVTVRMEEVEDEQK